MLCNKRLFLSFLHFTACGAGRIRKTYTTFEGLRNRHEFYQHPASLLRNETRLSTRGSECTKTDKTSRKNLIYQTSLIRLKSRAIVEFNCLWDLELNSFEIILRDWRRWHWKVSFPSKLLL